MKLPTKDQITFTAGLLGVMHQTLAETADRPYLFMLFAAMMGLPIVRKLDEKRNIENGQGAESGRKKLLHDNVPDDRGDGD